MPEGAVYVGRPSKWGNPYRVGQRSAYWTGPGLSSPRRPNPIPLMDADEVTSVYRRMVETNHAVFERGEVRELAGKDLACWCPLDQPCHADVLLELANVGRRMTGRYLTPAEQLAALDACIAALAARIGGVGKPQHPEHGCPCVRCTERDDWMESKAEARAEARRGDYDSERERDRQAGWAVAREWGA